MKIIITVMMLFWVSISFAKSDVTMEKINIQIIKEKLIKEPKTWHPYYENSVEEVAGDNTYIYSYDDRQDLYIIKELIGGEEAHFIERQYFSNGNLKCYTEVIAYKTKAEKREYTKSGKVISALKRPANWAHNVISLAKDRYGLDIIDMPRVNAGQSIRVVNINGRDLLWLDNNNLRNLPKEAPEGAMGHNLVFLDIDTLEEVGRGYIQYFSNSINPFMSYRVYMNGEMVIDRFMKNIP